MVHLVDRAKAPLNGEWRRALGFLRPAGRTGMTRSSTTRLLHEVAHLGLGLIALAAVTGLYFWLDLPLASAAFTYLIVIVLLSLVNSLASSIRSH